MEADPPRTSVRKCSFDPAYRQAAVQVIEYSLEGGRKQVETAAGSEALVRPNEMMAAAGHAKNL